MSGILFFIFASCHLLSLHYRQNVNFYFAFFPLTDQRVMGYGVIHPLHNPATHRIAPLLTENTGIAQILLLTLLSSVPKQKVFIDSPLTNVTFVNILTRDLRMEQIGETVRMYTKGNPGFPVQKTFGVLSPDAGCWEGEQIGETVRMYTKGNPGFPVQKTFGVLSPDAGCWEGEQIGETVRMYAKGNPGFPVQKTFGVLSPDAGCWEVEICLLSRFFHQNMLGLRGYCTP